MLIAASVVSSSSPVSIDLATSDDIPTNRHTTRPCLTSSHVIHRRGFNSLTFLDNGWHAHFSTFNPALPQPIASASLIIFYQKVMDAALILSSENHAFRISLDDIVLEMRSTGQVPIPWTLVYQFARGMFEASHRGFAGRYQGFLTHPTLPLDVGVHVWLRIRLVAEAA
ncbi:MAG: hypothetical protein HETSPECPRED_000812 [Heterodermia speciosa]|uniref:Uncharacterized protein n=1 Tax=Heterodermia speciosa TaxID=116794 RepID=A0A8H3F0B2_9LECA|nr:MAG: hypothetical protein HETSPECPRED_000812 [Heterodermia speciosa]